MNYVKLIGNLAKDAVFTLNKAQTGYVCKVRIATNEKEGSIVGTEFHNLIIIGSAISSAIALYNQGKMKTGSWIQVEGNLRSGEYINQDGTKAWFPHILVNKINEGPYKATAPMGIPGLPIPGQALPNINIPTFNIQETYAPNAAAAAPEVTIPNTDYRNMNDSGFVY